MALTLLRNEDTDTAEQELMIPYAPVIARNAPSLWGGKRGNFNTFVDDRNPFWRDAAIDQALRDIFAVGHEAYYRGVALPRNPAPFKGKTNPARQKKRQPFVSAGKPGCGQGMRLVEMHKIEVAMRQQSAHKRCCPGT